MSLSIGISVGSNVGKMKGFYANFIPDLSKASERSTKEMAENLYTQIRERTPVDRGALRNSVKLKKSKGIGGPGIAYGYNIVVGNVQRWGSDRSQKARKLYPWAQEYGYKSHWVKRTWMPAASKLRKSLESKDIMWVKVRKFTPYIRPAVQIVAHTGSKKFAKKIEKSLAITKQKYGPGAIIPVRR